MTEIPHLTLEEEKAKNRLSFPPVLAMDKNPKTSTNHQIQTHSCWGRTIKKRSITTLARWIPQCAHFPGCLVKHQGAHTPVPSSSAESIRYTACHMDPIIRTLIQQETGDPLCAQDTQLLFLASSFASQEHNSWTGSERAPTADTSHQGNAWAGRRWGCCFYINAHIERNNQ